MCLSLFFFNQETAGHTHQVHHVRACKTLSSSLIFFLHRSLDVNYWFPCYVFSALEALINFAYTGRVVIDMSNVQSLLIVASFLNLQPVKDACSTYLKNRSKLNSFLLYWELLLFLIANRMSCIQQNQMSLTKSELVNGNYL